MLKSLINRMCRLTPVSDREIFFREAASLITKLKETKFNILDFYGNVTCSGKNGTRLRRVSSDESIRYLSENFDPCYLGGSCAGRYVVFRSRKGKTSHTIELEYCDFMFSSPVYSEIEPRWHVAKKIRIDWLVESDQNS